MTTATTQAGSEKYSLPDKNQVIMTFADRCVLRRERCRGRREEEGNAGRMRRMVEKGGVKGRQQEHNREGWQQRSEAPTEAGWEIKQRTEQQRRNKLNLWCSPWGTSRGSHRRWLKTVRQLCLSADFHYSLLCAHGAKYSICEWANSNCPLNRNKSCPPPSPHTERTTKISCFIFQLKQTQVMWPTLLPVAGSLDYLQREKKKQKKNPKKESALRAWFLDSRAFSLWRLCFPLNKWPF